MVSMPLISNCSKKQEIHGQDENCRLTHLDILPVCSGLPLYHPHLLYRKNGSYARSLKISCSTCSKAFAIASGSASGSSSAQATCVGRIARGSSVMGRGEARSCSR